MTVKEAQLTAKVAQLELRLLLLLDAMGTAEKEGLTGAPIVLRGAIPKPAGQGMVIFAWGEQRTFFSPEQARSLAFDILDTAFTAESDGMLSLFLHSEGVDPAAWLKTYREFSEKNAEADRMQAVENKKKVDGATIN